MLRLDSVPKLVKLLLMTFALRVVPVRFDAALTVIVASGKVIVRLAVGLVNAKVVELVPFDALKGVATPLTVIPVEPTVREDNKPTDVKLLFTTLVPNVVLVKTDTLLTL